MTKARVTSTDALANVIEVVELGQRTGLLSVERGSGSVQETGEIYFVLGRPIYASLAGLRGREALTALGRWGACRFSFDRDALRPAPNLSPPSAQPGQAGYGSFNSGPSYGPPNQTPSSHPGAASPPYGNPTPRSFDSSAVWPMQTGMPDGAGGNGNPYGGNAPAPPGSGVLPGQSTPQGPGRYDGSFSQHSQYPIPNTPSQYGAFPSGSYGGSQGRMPQMGGPLSRRPRRAPDVRDLMTVVTTHNLSRGHRTLLLLADGEHSVLDLARLSSKSVDEVISLLADLESRSLVYYYG